MSVLNPRKSGLSKKLKVSTVDIQIKQSELKNLEWDIHNPDYLIWVSNGQTFDFLLKPFFLGYSREKIKPVF